MKKKKKSKKLPPNYPFQVLDAIAVDPKDGKGKITIAFKPRHYVGSCTLDYTGKPR